MNTSIIQNGISIDLEEYYHASNLLPFLKKHTKRSRLEQSLMRTLTSLDKSKVQATFFILGEVAQMHPEAIKRIAAAGHEIAAHSFSHRCIYDLDRAKFKEEVYRVKELLEQLTGSQVLGFRAPNFSINQRTPWAHEILAELGYAYDSSIYPVHHPRYSNPNQSREIQTAKTKSGDLLIVPLATYAMRIPFMARNLNLPLAGGAYWRLLPRSLIKAGLSSINKKESLPFFCYYHPWELDPEQPQLTSTYSLTGWRHYHNIGKFDQILADYFSAFNFTSYANVLGLKQIM